MNRDDLKPRHEPIPYTALEPSGILIKISMEKANLMVYTVL